MTFEQRCTIAAPPERVWALVMDVPQVALCVPGVRDVAPEGDQSYRGQLGVAVGPIRLSLQGKVMLQEQDQAHWKATMRAEAADRRLGGGVNATMELVLVPQGDNTELVITTNATFLGKLGEFGQAVIRKKADTLLQEFAANLQARLAEG